MKFEKRFLGEPVELRKAATGAVSLRGYASVFNSLSHDLGGFVEIIAPGAFDEVLSRGEDVIATALDHEGIIGRSSSKTLRLSVDERGLHYEVDLPDTQAGRDLAVLVERGDVRGSSFGFRVKSENLEERADGTILRTVLAIDRLRDVGPVVNPAYEATEVSLRALELRNRAAAKPPTPAPFPEARLRRQIDRLTNEENS